MGLILMSGRGLEPALNHQGTKSKTAGKIPGGSPMEH